MTTTENNMQNLHPDIQQRLYDLTVLTYISNIVTPSFIERNMLKSMTPNFG